MGRSQGAPESAILLRALDELVRQIGGPARVAEPWIGAGRQEPGPLRLVVHVLRVELLSELTNGVINLCRLGMAARGPQQLADQEPGVKDAAPVAAHGGGSPAQRLPPRSALT